MKHPERARRAKPESLGEVPRRRAAASIAWAAAALIAPASAWAQGAPEEPGAPRMTRTASATAVDLFGAEVSRTPPGAPGGSPSEEDPAWRFYHQAFMALAAGRRAESIELLHHIGRAYASHPVAARAAEVLRRLEEKEPPPGELARRSAVERGEGRDEPPNAFARAELVVAQTLHGIGLGLELCLLAGCEDSRAIGAAMVAGGGTGLGLSLLLTGDGITPGHAAFLNAGTVWGAATGLFVAGTINPSEARVVPASMLAGQLAGLGMGHLLWRVSHGSAGDVALASSGGLWTGFLATMTLMTVTNGDPDGVEPVFGTLLAATTAGLAAGALLADRFPVSRGRLLVIDGGGAVGTLVGVGSALIIQSEEPAPYFLFPAIGAVGGLVLTTYLTRDWDDEPAPDVAFGVAPYKGGAMINVSAAW